MNLDAAAVLFDLILFLAGASVFSFLNVLVWRIPRRISFIRGRSVCESCGHVLGMRELCPVFGWIWVRGRCRYCGAKLPVSHLLYELLGGLLLIGCGRWQEYTAEALLWFLFFGLLTAVARIDWQTMEIPDGLTAACAILGVTMWILGLHPEAGERLIGAVCVSLPMFVLAVVIPGAFGGGDIKLMAACGLVLGWKQTVTAMFLAVLAGGIYGGWLLFSGKKGRKEQFAFGPFLCMGMGAAAVYGEQLLTWYLSLF